MSRFRGSQRILVVAMLTGLAAVQAGPTAAMEPQPTMELQPLRHRPSVDEKRGAVEAGRQASPAPRGGDFVRGQRRLGYEEGDDWEPSIAADGRHVYVAWTHFPIAGTLQKKRVLLQASHDGGATWGRPRIVADEPGGKAYSDQGDPVVRVDLDGTVYVSMIAWGYRGDFFSEVYVARSDDRGETFPVVRQASVNQCRPTAEGCDKEWVTVRNGHVYVGYANADSRMYVSSSHDRGQTWTERAIRNQDAVVFAGGAAVDSTGRVYFAWDICTDDECVEPVKMVVSHSEDGGVTWRHRLVATVAVGTQCPYVECGFAFFSPQIALAIDSNDVAVAAYSQAPGPNRFPVMVTKRSTDGGETWTDHAKVGPGGARRSAQLFPAVTATGPGRFVVTWMDDRFGDPQHGANGWHVFAARSDDRGRSWTDEKRVSVIGNEAQWQENGFLFPYGDYQDATFTRGKVHAAFGAGHDYIGPGNVYTRAFDWTD